MRQRLTRSILPLAALVGVSVVGGCNENTGPQDNTARVTVALTDAPDAMFDEASVEIGAVSLTRAGGPHVVLTDAGGTHDLLMLQDGVMVDLATLDIDPGRYLQLRLVVLSASVTLAEGLEFADGTTSRDLFVPSGAQSGIKINLRTADGDDASAGVDISSGETILVVDMDVSQNFKIQGSSDTPAGIRDVKFTPLLRATVEDVAGSISGAVTYPSATPADETEFAQITADLDPATSTVLEAMQTTAVTTVTGADSTYTLWFLSPGTYDVSAGATIGGTDFSDGPQSVSVGDDEAVTGVDFSL
ncbi:MAG: DUF4382 domain-containing protein [Gemmatimonadota bacterium]